MNRRGPWHRTGASLLGIGLLAASVQSAASSEIAWERRGPFEACLEQRVSAWVFARAELVINEDTAAAEIDDMDVALWATAALQDCEAQAGRGNQTSEQRFSRHMAHWREHIDKVAQMVRKRAGAD